MSRSIVSRMLVTGSLALLISLGTQLIQPTIASGAQATATQTIQPSPAATQPSSSPTLPPTKVPSVPTATKAAQSSVKTATMLRQWASKATATSQYSPTEWNASQATGAPDTQDCGDHGTAWASSSASGKDSLTLHFEQAVTPTEINIYQTYNPGAIISVELLPADGSSAIEVEDSADPGTDCPGVFSLAITLDDIKPINGVKINLDQTLTESWDEIDAVELVGTARENVASVPKATSDANTLRQWASDASATSEYGNPNWSAAQAIGEPNTQECSDAVTAWASSSSTGQDSLTLRYDQPVHPTEINIYQTYSPGAIISVELLPADGSASIHVPDSADSGTSCPGIFSLNITLNDIKPINGVKINLDQTLTGNWNEIDAVELVGKPSP